MVYDCFTFFNELDLLEIRLNVLKDVVDRFVLIEAGETHTGKPKPFYFEVNRNRFAAFADRIIYHKIDKFPAGHDAWWNENYQRNEIAKVLARVGARDGDDILISDLDEIPNPDEVAKWKGTKGVKTFRQTYYSFYLNNKDVRTPGLCITKMMPYETLLHAYDDLPVTYDEFLPENLNSGTTVTKVRRRRLPRSRGGEIEIRRGGWHFTCLGGAEAMLTKMRAVAPHAGFDPDDSSLTVKRMERLIAEGRGPALRMNCFAVPIDESFPRHIRDNVDRYSHLIFPITPEYMRAVRLPRVLRTLQGNIKAFAERLCPPEFHRWLHLLKRRICS